MPERKFSITHKCWWLPLTRENYKLAFHTLSLLGELDTTAMRKWIADLDAKTVKTATNMEEVKVSCPEIGCLQNNQNGY